jgi:hypothetical protein
LNISFIQINRGEKRKERRRKLKDKTNTYGDVWFQMDEETRYKCNVRLVNIIYI